MNKNSQRFLHRRSIRLKGYDYSSPGVYFVTLVSWQRKYIFGTIESGNVKLNSIGAIIESEWLRLEDQFRRLSLGMFIVMPNHLHGILTIEGDFVGATQPSFIDIPSGQANNLFRQSGNPGGSPLRPHGPPRGSLGAMIGQFKSRATKRIWELPEISQNPVWQRNYYEHIIRNSNSLEDIYRYILGNPANWDEDEYYSNI